MKAEEVIAVLDALARHLGTTADFLIPLFARRAIGAACAELAVVALVAVIGLRAWRWTPSEEAVNDSDGYVFVIKWFAVAVVALLASLLFVDVVQTLASPEAAAVAEILQKLHGK